MDGRSESDGAIARRIAGVAGARDDGGASVADAEAVAEPEVADGHVPLGHGAHEVGRNELTPILHHLRARDGGLQPGAMVEGGVPEADRRVKAAAGQLERVSEVVAE